MKITLKPLHLASLLSLAGIVSAPAAAVISDGSDGPFHPTFSQPIALPPDGVMNYTTIYIPTNVTIWFIGNATNTPAFLAATGSVVIEGTIDLNATHYYGNHSAGGESGGAAGLGDNPGADGSGLGGGAGGPVAVYGMDGTVRGNAGGGGGMFTAGQTATSRTGNNPGAGHPALTRPVLTPGVSGGGGAGGGGGCGIVFNTIPVYGGNGGAGGGAIQISTPGTITFSGSILANGGHAGSAYANGNSYHAGPGGGGAGGNIEFYADTMVFSHAHIEARGGFGGGLSYEPVSSDPAVYNCGATGGRGFVFVEANHVSVDSATVIDAHPNFVRPSFTDIRYQAGNVILQGSGRTNRVFELLSATNLMESFNNWTPVVTNSFDANGNFILTNAITPGEAQRFFLLRSVFN